MKLLELHIRNIASIVSADIDFERDLLDPDTGLPAQMFLICGDTGTGKSVLLDAIAMTLFANTPRMREVADKRENRFTDTDGRQVNIGSLEQYTRLGIGPRDECYSSTRFEGNDGRCYTATRRLGITARGNFRNEWLLQCEGQPDLSGIKCAPAILQAIGMTYEQFFRMAMLAQGQFTSFLCASRNERADILEKLTDTARFSLYGTAIQALAKQKAEAYRALDTALAERRQQMLPPDEADRLSAVRDLARQKADCLKGTLDTLQLQLQWLHQVALQHELRTKAEADRAALEVRMQGDEYKALVRLVAEWDATAQPRATLAEADRRRIALASSQADLSALRGTFAALCMHNQALAQQVEAAEAEAERVRQWVAAQAGLEPLYGTAAELAAGLDTYHREASRHAALCAGRERLLQALPAIEAAHAAAVVEHTAAQQALAAVQQQMDDLSRRMAALEPEATLRRREAEAEAVRRHTAALDALQALSQQRAELQARTTALAEHRAMLARSQAEAEALRLQAAEADTCYRQALGRYTTMHAGVEQTLTSLREQMLAAHAEVCPLCRQQIGPDAFAHLGATLDAEALLSPLKHERDEAQAAYARLSQQYHEATARLGQQNGLVAGLEAEVNGRTEALRRTEAEAARLLQQLGIDPTSLTSDPALADHLRAQAEAHSQAERALAEQSRAIAELQARRNALEADRKRLDADLGRKGETLAAQAKALEGNRAEAERLRAEGEALAATLATMAEGLDARLLPHYPWRERPDQVATRIRTDAKHYQDRTRELEARTAALAQLRQLQERVAAKQQALAAAHPDWEQMSVEDGLSPQRDNRSSQSPFSTLEAAWDTLADRHTSLLATIGTLATQLAEADAQLADFFAQSGHTADTLRALAARAPQVEPARRTVADVRAALAVARQSIAQADEALATLQASPHATTVDATALQSRLGLLQAQRDAAIGTVADATSRLDADSANALRLAALQADADRARALAAHWETLNRHFGGDRFRNLVQTHILRPLLASANTYLSRITDRYTLDCADDNQQLAILVHDRYNRGELRSATVLSGGERFMVSLALSLALSSLGRDDLGVNILFIDEGFGTLDQQSLDSVMRTLSALGTIAGGRRVGIISHREELSGCIPNKVKVEKMGEGRSRVTVAYEP